MCEIALIPFSDNGQLTATTPCHGDFETRAATGVGMRKDTACVENFSTIFEILLINQRRHGLFPYICKCRVGHGDRHLTHGLIEKSKYGTGQPVRGDMDGDGRVSIKDVMDIIDIILTGKE